MCLAEVDSQQPQQVAANGKVVDVVKMSRMLRCTALIFCQDLRSRQILRYDMDIHIRHVSQNFESNYDLEQIALDIKTLMHLVMLEVVGDVLARTIHES